MSSSSSTKHNNNSSSRLPPQNEVLLDAETKYKGEMGRLISTTTKLLWVRQTSPNTPSLVIDISDIKTQLAAQNPKLKIILHSDVPSSSSSSSSSSSEQQIDIKKVPGSIFEFTSSNAMTERNAFRDLIATLIKAYSSASSTSTTTTTTTTTTASPSPSLSSSLSSTPFIMPASRASLSTAELKQRASLLASNRDLQILYNQLVKTQIISEEEFWQSRQEMLENEALKKFFFSSLSSPSLL